MKFLVVSFLVMAVAEYNIEPYIHNGRQAKDGQMPFQVGLEIKLKRGKIWCGGSLISPTFILTAAHCINAAPAKDITAYLGSIIREKGTQMIPRRKIVHSKWSNYKYSSAWYDIGLLEISHVSYTNYIRSIDLPDISDSYPDYEGNVAIVSGWGMTNETPRLSRILQYAELVVISNAACSGAHNGLLIPKPAICAADSKGAVHCHGDSGGPLVDRDNGTLIGIVSFGPSNVGCKPHLGNGYTRVTYFRRWIKNKAGI